MTYALRFQYSSTSNCFSAEVPTHCAVCKRYYTMYYDCNDCTRGATQPGCEVGFFILISVRDELASLKFPATVLLLLILQIFYYAL